MINDNAGAELRGHISWVSGASLLPQSVERRHAGHGMAVFNLFFTDAGNGDNRFFGPLDGVGDQSLHRRCGGECRRLLRHNGRAKERT